MILVVDVGTSGTKFLLIDEQGKICYIASEKYSLQYPSSGAVTMDIERFTFHLMNGLAAVGAHCLEGGIALAGISITSQRSSVIPVASDGSPLSHALMWQDTRSQKICDALVDRTDEIRNICAMVVSPIYSAPKMAYLRETMNEVYQAADKLVGFCEYTLFKLTNSWATDTSIASRTALFNIQNLRWSDELLDIFTIEEKKLCPLIEVGAMIERTTNEITRLLGQTEPVPVFSAGGDQQCAALGNGTLATGDISANFGSGAYVLGLCDHPLIPGDKRVVCNVGAIAGTWQVESSFSSCGMTIDWLDRMLFKSADEPYPYTNFMDASRRAPIGSHGVRFSIHLAGLKNISGRAFASGGILNITNATTKDDLARSVLEGIAASFSDHFDLVRRELEGELQEIGISGGLTKDSFFNQMISSMTGIGARTWDNPQATASGAWISTATQLGLYPSEAEAFDVMASQLNQIRYVPDKLDGDLYRQIKDELNQWIGSIEQYQ